MGYWKDTTDFVVACEQLTRLLAESVGLQQGDRLLDVGFGCGDQILLFLEYKPQHIHGITNERQQFQFAQERIQHENVRLECQDAVHGQLDKYNKITALDCAYHFSTRSKFLKNCHQALLPGGKIGLADICLQSGKASMFDHFISFLLSVSGTFPKDNMITMEDYEQMLMDIGFQNPSFQDISDLVFPGLQRFIKRRCQGEKSQYLNPDLTSQFSMMQYFLSWAQKRLRFVIVVAEKMH
ncbi:S-adenosyl-L-methionine-dependent methyltransferase [Gorgonomyces haynaldii]|nr:S-adenosyl-L-methionine-dependent methyltransferase [Gorgonomyces haynaldii]